MRPEFPDPKIRAKGFGSVAIQCSNTRKSNPTRVLKQLEVTVVNITKCQTNFGKKYSMFVPQHFCIEVVNDKGYFEKVSDYTRNGIQSFQCRSKI